MSSKFTLQALALTGILAVSGLPAFAADLVPAAPLPNASVSTDSNAKIGTGSHASVGTTAKSTVDKTKTSADKKATKVAKTAKDSAAKTDKTVHEQTAQHPAASAGANSTVGTGNAAGANASVGATVH